MDVFRITVEISKQVFPVLVDIENPAFLEKLRRLQQLAVKIEAARNGGILGRVKVLAFQAQCATTFLSLFLLPTKPNALPEQALLSPAW
jgi:magnesium-protoporphyrin IX monomethyl ester (oxidative) cyclase